MATPLERATVLPPAWGARVDGNRRWADDNTYKPHLWILHYGGGANPAGIAPYSQQSEMRVLRAWEGWHMSSSRPQGQMRAIAYNDLIGQTGTHYMGRGPHNNGGQYGHWNNDSRAVAFILGGTQIPSPEARRTFGRVWLEDPMDGTILGHRDTGQTECPGDWIETWIKRQGWIADLGVWSQGQSDPVVSSVKVRLWRLGKRPWPSFGPVFTAGLRTQVQGFQEKYGIQPDGVVGPQTFKALGGLLGEEFPGDHADEPTDTPEPSRWGAATERWRPLVARYFLPGDVEKALGLIRCESVGDPNAVSHKEWTVKPAGWTAETADEWKAKGLFQHLPRYWPERAAAAGFPGASIFDPEANIAAAAWLVYKTPGGWGHWSGAWAGVDGCLEWAEKQLAEG